MQDLMPLDRITAKGVEILRKKINADKLNKIRELV